MFIDQNYRTQIVVTPDPTQGEYPIWQITFQNTVAFPAIITYPAAVAIGVATPNDLDRVNTSSHGILNIKNKRGSEIYSFDTDGARFNYQMDSPRIADNTNLDLGKHINKWTDSIQSTPILKEFSFSTGSGPQDSDALAPGAWLGFCDATGTAAVNTISLNASGGWTINGSTGPVTLINTNWGSARLLMDRSGLNTLPTSGNWILQKWA